LSILIYSALYFSPFAGFYRLPSPILGGVYNASAHVVEEAHHHPFFGPAIARVEDVMHQLGQFKNAVLEFVCLPYICFSLQFVISHLVFVSFTQEDNLEHKAIDAYHAVEHALSDLVDRFPAARSAREVAQRLAQVCGYVCMCVCVSVCMYVCLYVCVPGVYISLIYFVYVLCDTL